MDLEEKRRMTTNDYKERRKKKHDFYSRLVPRYQYGGQHSEYFIDLIKIPKLHRKDTAKSTRRNCSFSHQLFFIYLNFIPVGFSHFQPNAFVSSYSPATTRQPL